LTSLAEALFERSHAASYWSHVATKMYFVPFPRQCRLRHLDAVNGLGLYMTTSDLENNENLKSTSVRTRKRNW